MKKEPLDDILANWRVVSGQRRPPPAFPIESAPLPVGGLIAATVLIFVVGGLAGGMANDRDTVQMALRHARSIVGASAQ